MQRGVFSLEKSDGLYSQLNQCLSPADRLPMQAHPGDGVYEEERYSSASHDNAHLIGQQDQNRLILLKNNDNDQELTSKLISTNKLGMNDLLQIEEEESKLIMIDTTNGKLENGLADGQIIEEEEDDGDDYPLRQQLPILRDPTDRPSMWKILKSAVGKDISKFSVPVYMNEPISMIQKVVELMEYENLLVQANAETDSKMRLNLVAAFGAA